MIRAVGAVDDDVVRLSVAGRRGAVEVQVDLRNIRSGQIIDRDGVGTAERVEVNLLDTVEVHRDVGDVTREPDPSTVGRDSDILSNVRTVEDHRVGASLSL